MSVFRMNRPKNFLTTMKFSSYNAAIAFANQSGMLNPTKPYKRLAWKNDEQVLVWCVTLVCSPADASKATFEKLAA